MKKRIMNYWRYLRSDVLHIAEVMYQCHYFTRGNFTEDIRNFTSKPRGCRVCDECQRLAKLAKLAKK